MKEAAEIVFADPEPEIELTKLAIERRDDLVAGVRRVSLAKALSMAGLWQAATAIFDGDTTASQRSFSLDIQRNELSFAGYELNSKDKVWERVVTQTSFEPESDDSTRMVGFTASYKTTIPTSFVDAVTAAIGGGKKVERMVVDKWLNERLTENRKERLIEIAKKIDSYADLKSGIRGEDRITSAWAEFKDTSLQNEKYVGWTTGQGFGFAISRTRFE